ncbi:oligosaccharide repeat unit polymerase family protein [Paenibacillus pasadenensis]|uniref:oligosaccharide repeat unit polymerase n=1 Tax=Paenibacillus pasadenensis TaxID=217090 RepID=UPI00203EE23E|nr:oligosaccharide repeat unit polymerase [Paenibacillus pasadenensis]MCM3749162.1 oligosaccharide repeat unit polymerase family protein [Paenibacillus pasadenensis]
MIEHNDKLDREKWFWKILLSFCVIIFSFWLTQGISGSLNKTFLLIFVMSCLIISVVGVLNGIKNKKFIDFMSPYILFPLMYLVIYAPGTNEVMKLNPQLGDKMLFFLFTGLIMFLIGAWSASSIFLKASHRGSFDDSGIIYTKWIKFYFILGVFFILVYWIKSGGIPIFSSDLENSRVSAISGNGIPFYMSLLMSVAVWLHFIKSDQYTVRKHLIPLLITVILLMSTGWRSTAVAFIFITLAIYHYKKPISLSKLGLIGTLIISFITIMGLFRIRSSNSKFELNDMMESGNYIGAFMQYLYNYPVVFGKDILSAIISTLPNSNMPLQYGKTFLWNFQLMIPGNEAEPFDFILKGALGRGFDGGGLPPTLLGDLYINFAFPGIAVGMLLLGFAWSTLHYLMARNTTNIIGLVAAIIIYFFSVSIRGGIENITLMTAWLCFGTIILFTFAYFPQKEVMKRVKSEENLKILRKRKFNF